MHELTLIVNNSCAIFVFKCNVLGVDVGAMCFSSECLCEHEQWSSCLASSRSTLANTDGEQ